MKKQVWSIVFCAIFLAFSIQAQTGGTYDLSHSVIASGGGSNSTGGVFSLSGTAGQPSAGTISTGNNFSLRGGFWVFESFVPTAATVSISGRVTTADGRGIRNARLTLIDASGAIRSMQSGNFGSYRFDEVESGQFYILTVTSRNFVFAQPTQTLNMNE